MNHMCGAGPRMCPDRRKKAPKFRLREQSAWPAHAAVMEGRSLDRTAEGPDAQPGYFVEAFSGVGGRSPSMMKPWGT